MGKGDERTDLVYVTRNFWQLQYPVLTHVAHARILYAWKLTPTSTLDVISTYVSGCWCAYTSYIIMTDTTRNIECMVLLSSTSCDSSYVVVRLERLLDCLSERLAPLLSESLYNFFMKILLYIANTMFLNTEELMQGAGNDAFTRGDGHW